MGLASLGRRPLGSEGCSAPNGLHGLMGQKRPAEGASVNVGSIELPTASGAYELVPCELLTGDLRGGRRQCLPALAVTM